MSEPETTPEVTLDSLSTALDALESSENPETTTGSEASVETQPGAVTEVSETAPLVMEEIISNYIQNRFNVPVEYIERGVKIIASIQEREAVRQTNEILEEVGFSRDEIDEARTTLGKTWSKLPVEMQNALDNPEGAKLLAKSLYDRKNKKPTSVGQSTGGRTAGSSSDEPQELTYEVIQKMTPREYQANIREITEFFRKSIKG